MSKVFYYHKNSCDGCLYFRKKKEFGEITCTHPDRLELHEGATCATNINNKCQNECEHCNFKLQCLADGPIHACVTCVNHYNI